MGKLKPIWIACLVLFASQAVFSQSLKVGFGLVDERRWSASQIQMDTLVGYEQTNFSTAYPMPFVSVQYPISNKWLFNLGVQYYVSSIAFAVEYTSETWPDYFPSMGKGWGTVMRNIEVPIGLSYRIIGLEKLKVYLDLNASPVFAIQDFRKLELEPQGLDWTQEVIDALNAAETIPKSFYMNYQYGISVEYKRIGLTFIRSANMNRSISNGYTLYGQEYNYMRRTQTNRLGIYYSFGLKKDKEKSIN
ncbi:hypothetical protein [Cognataquiflexum aquatile]|uniref:hypothetical protein n=1 Tax=Cognataquiflexum aquatile TaxID=2249427 RepID=UPI000DEAEF0D|nr:hypothetical protein [Cognataquiflexum aquatile]